MQWKDERPWYNDRIIETIISSDMIDFHDEIISQDAIYRVLPFLAQHGIYNYWHTNFPIGEIIGWRINEKGLPMIKVGIHDTKHSNIPQHDDVWKEIKQFGTRGQSSIEGVSNLMNSGGGKPDTITDMGLWAVAWVADGAANPAANVTYVNEMAKFAKSISVIPDNSGNLVKEIGGKQMAEETKPPVISKKEEEEVPPVSDVIPEAKPEALPPEEEKAVEPPVDKPIEQVPQGLAQQVAALTEKVAMLAEALELIRNGTPEAIADAADAAEVVSAAIQETKTEDRLAGNEQAPAEQPPEDLMQMKAALEEAKAENTELKQMAEVIEKKAETAEVQASVKEQPKPEPTPARRSVQTANNAGNLGFNVDEMMDAVNRGKQSEYFREKFKIDRKIAR